MKKCYELNKEDIKAIIAEHFGCSVLDVILSIKDVPVGYGVGEQMEHIITATVVSKHE